MSGWSALRLSIVGLLTFVVLLPSGVQGQVPFEPGYVLRAETDTLQGDIRNPEWVRTPETIQFRPSATASVQRLSVRDIAGFGVGGAAYERIAVEIDQRPTSADRPFPVEGVMRRDTIFARRLVEGTIDLYRYQNDRVHFFARRAGKDLQELIYHVRRVESERGTFDAASRQYRYQLEQLKTDACRNRSTERIRYTRQSLVQFALACNGQSESAVVAGSSRGGGVQVQHQGEVRWGSASTVHEETLPSITVPGRAFGGGYVLMLTRNRPMPAGAILLRLGVERHVAEGTGSRSAKRDVRLTSGASQTIEYRLQEWDLTAILAQVEVAYRYRFTDGRVRPFADTGIRLHYPLAYDGEGEGTVTIDGSTSSRSYDLDAWTTVQPGVRLGAGAEWGRISARIDRVWGLGIGGSSAVAPGLRGVSLTAGYRF